MSHKVIGFFNDISKVKIALQRLTCIDIIPDHIYVTSIKGCSSEVAHTTGQSETIKKREEENIISRFFKSLFKEDDNLDRYSRVALRSKVIVKVMAKSYSEAEEAANILDECGALDIDERGI